MKRQQLNGVAVLEFSRMIRVWFIRRGAPARFGDEIESAAQLAVVERHHRTGIPFDGNHAYYFVVAKRQAAEAIKQSIAPYRIGGRAARAGVFDLPPTVPAAKLEDVLGGALGPEEVAAKVEAERARARLAKRLLGHARAMPAPARRNVAHLLQELAPGVKVPRRRPTRNATWNSVARLRNVVAKNQRAREDRCAMILV